MNLHCPQCGAPIPNEPAEHFVGAVRFDAPDCIRRWFADGRHRDRRQSFRPVYPDRRAS